MWRRGIAVMIAAAVVAGCKGKSEAPITDTASTEHTVLTSFTSGGPYVFVSNEDGNDVTVIDTKTDSVVGTLEPGQRPRGVRVSPDGKTLIVAVSGSPKGGPGVDEKTLPPADRTKDGIALIDLSTGKKVANLPGGLDPESFAVSSDGKTIYASNEGGGTISVLDLKTNKIIATFHTGKRPRGIAFTPDGKKVYITNEVD